MVNNDTIYLLRECDSGSKMAVSAIDEMYDKADSPALKQLMTESREHHEKLGNEIHSRLVEYGSEEKDPNAMAKGMSWMKTNMKMTMDDSDSTIADLLTDGCNMGIKSLYRYQNQYKGADAESKDICQRLVSIEEELRQDLRPYL